MSFRTGLSPRVRGNPRCREHDLGQQGSIPACAGKPLLREDQAHEGGVYPRVCGETVHPIGCSSHCSGLSPRVRGNRQKWPPPSPPSGSIPACAGKPLKRIWTISWQWVYPRVCGETDRNCEAPTRFEGLSPRVRGNRRAADDCRAQDGSIPACAGKPTSWTGSSMPDGVYPRVCGETNASLAGLFSAGGLSPRVRESGLLLLVSLSQKGLSPRVRGNPTRRSLPRFSPRSIPACAGKPREDRAWRAGTRVYPRVCGETDCPTPTTHSSPGLSPRVRGNLGSFSFPIESGGSIPACAGKPVSRSTLNRCARVYPRVCGETYCTRPSALLISGLSPRVRGNLRFAYNVLVEPGSIPACAGKPSQSTDSAGDLWVYPRVCGET